MLDFLMIAMRNTKNGLEIYPKFVIKKSGDLMIRGSDFYAIWDESKGLWSTEEQDAIRLIDREMELYVKESDIQNAKILHLWDSENGMIDRWHKYCQKQMRDNFEMLDEKLIFSNTETNKKDYASKRLTYPLEPGPCPSYEKLISTLYSEEERRKIEWAIGSIITGDSKTIQKFMVLYGAAGTGKSTILNIIQQLFDGYYSVFDAKAIGSANSSFALEPFKTNPLVAIQHDGDLSRIEDNTRLNSLVSHEWMTINEKFKSAYTNRFKCFLFMGTNKPVKITDGKSGLIRRLIDVHPSGNKVSAREYKQLVKKIEFELGAIASHCRDVYLEDPGIYDNYIPTEMMGASNDFYNFIVDSYRVFKKEDGTTLKAAWEMWKNYCEEAKVPFTGSQRVFKEELKNYFREYNDRFDMEDGTVARRYYSGFRTDKFEIPLESGEKEEPKLKLIEFGEYESIFDKECSDYIAQYASAKETPKKSWEKVTTKLSDLNTNKLHYVKVPENHIVIDFDFKDENGNKSFEKNLKEASKWPETYAELSKSGGGIHLHYIYTGDPSKLSRVYDDNIEVKVFTGNSALRRKLTKCNQSQIASISSGLPLKGDDEVINFEGFKNEKALRTLIKKNLNKEYHASTKCSMDFIYDSLEKAYNSGLKYDVSDMENMIFSFAANSTNQSDYCIKLMDKMKFKSDESSDGLSDVSYDNAPLVFYDVEVFKNLFIICWKVAGEGAPVVRMINPKPSEVEQILSFKLVGFNNRRYDNHILYAAMLGYDNEGLYNLSQKLINSKKGENMDYFFREAYNISYTDIYDFASAGNKKSLKKFEIELGIHHLELGLPWDRPVPENLWEKAAEYCCNDVIATEAVFYHLKGDWTARQILADLAGMTVNDTTNTLTTKIIFGNNRKPQDKFNYRNLADPVLELPRDVKDFLKEACPEMMSQLHGDAHSFLPYFHGYKYANGVSTYRGEEVGEGGYVYAEPGMYGNVALLDVSSMHPHSAIAECLFGVEFTRAFRDIVEGRVDIKHEAWDVVSEALGGKLKPYIQKVIDGEMTSKDLANALKTAINSVYGLTSAKFDNAFRDIRNKDNIVAKRGALFMVDLKHAVQERGFTVVHIKTDSIKIADATPEIIQFVMDFGKKYGYTFEHEATYDKICLVNDAVYIAKYKGGKEDGKWTATGKQFAVPYVFKTLFSKEQIEFNDLCEVFSVKSALYLDMNEKLPDVSGYEKELDKLESDYKKGKILDTTFEPESKRLNEEISKGHDYRFVGKVGQFCPIKPGEGGGLLMREQNSKYYAATGTTGYRWLESEVVLKEKVEKTITEEKTGEIKTIKSATAIPGNNECIDISYYRKLVDDAVEAIGQYGDFEWFVSDEPYVSPIRHDFINVPEDAPEGGLPFDLD